MSLLLLVRSFYSVVGTKGKDEAPLLSCYLIMSIFSFLAVSEIGSLAKVMPVTWQRNGSFISLFLGVALLLSFSGLIRYVSMALLLVNGALGFSTLYSTTFQGEPWKFPIQEPGIFGFLQANTIRKSFPEGSVLRCFSHSEITCNMYAEVLGRKKISIVWDIPPGIKQELGPCAGFTSDVTHACLILPGEKTCRTLCQPDGTFHT